MLSEEPFRPPGAGRPAGSFLVPMFYGGGNVDLIVPVVRELVSRGHRVRILAGPRIFSRQPGPTAAFNERLRDTGAVVRPLPEPAANPHDGAAPLRGLVRGWVPRRLKKALNLGLAARWWGVWAAATAAEVEREGPDVVAADHFLLGAAAAAEAAGLPHAFLVHNANHPAPVPGLPPPGTGFDLARNRADLLRDRLWTAAFDRISVRDSLPHLNRARSELGLPPLRSPFEQYERAARVIVLSSRAFAPPADRLSGNVRYAGTVVENARGGEWESPWPGDDSRPLVLVNLSTLDQGQAPLMTRILEAVAELPIRVLVTLGPLDRGRYRVPPNVHLETYVPHAAVLPQAALVVSQCGLGTVTKALLHGVPLVCLPWTADQPDNAARVVALGAGVRLAHDCSGAGIRAAIELVLGDPRYRAAARRVGAEMAAEKGAETAATELESLLPEGPR